MTRTSSAQPEWAHGLGASGYGIFVGLVRAYFEERGIVIDFDVDSGVIRTALSERATQSAFGLLNLAQVCRQADRDAWRDVVRAHFDTVFAASNGDSALRVDVHHLESCRDMLRARLYPLDITRQSDELVSRPGPPGTLEVLVLDLPTSVRTVSRHEADAWGVTDAALFEMARGNLMQAGALSGLVSRYYNVGQFTAHKAEQILVGRVAPSSIPVETLKRFSYQIRMAAAHKLKLPPPLPMFNYAELITGEVGSGG
jgi:hypothetical protein